ncbi:MAG: 1,4-beta-xylanase [Bacteroidia bacterium]|nr:1,4-beta-xylanase [Bacteroidia bacterium]
MSTAIRFLKTTFIFFLLSSCTNQNYSTLNFRWSEVKAKSWYDSLPWIKGFNFVPSYAGNTTEWWEIPPDTAVIGRELGWASDLHYNSTRVFLQYIVWKKDPAAFKNNFAIFLELASSRHISVIPVLFDDCAFGRPAQVDPYLGKQRDIIPGMILSNWTPSPGTKYGTDPAETESLRAYVHDLLKTFGNDKRIILWDLFNEPMNEARVGTPDFMVRLFVWAREANPGQPLSTGVWFMPLDHPLNMVLIAYSDIITYHLYGNKEEMTVRIAQLKKQGRPVMCTEWMARPAGSSYEKELPLFKSEKVAAYQWGLVNGRTQCQFPWWNQPGGGVDSTYGWFHDILHADGTPYRPEEIDVIRKY